MVQAGHRFPHFIVVASIAILAAAPLRAVAQTPAKDTISMATEDRLQSAGWWPTKGTAPRREFVGAAECAKCHSKEATAQATTPMAHAATQAANSEILHERARLSLQLGPYSYQVSHNNDATTYSVSDAHNSISAPLAWAFGLGQKGQTYLYQRNGSFYESRLSFYKTLQNLDLTTGHSTTTPDDLESALGRRLDADEAKHCFGCHTTASGTDNRFDPTYLTPGVTCESCHGPGAAHVAAMKAGKIDDGRRATLNPAHLGPFASVDFCGACHRTWADVLQAGTVGVINARFQPYRLESSRCWRQGDARLTCTACHDPHQQLVRDASSYDQNCLSCHLASATTKPMRDHPGAACPISTKNCVTCHMPQVELPSMHAPFTDHRIRIARPAAPYPN
jgi:hypothetical protein